MAKFQFRHYERRLGTDTVVFVHGLTGDIVTTWGKFPELLRSDPDLPDLDVFLCGYKSRFFRWDPDVEEAGKRLMAELEIQVDRDSKIFLVGHSLGGLVLFAGLTRHLRDGHAQVPPCSNIELITLFASPVNGSQAAQAISAVWHLVRLLPFIPVKALTFIFASRQVANLARGEFVDELVAEIVDRVYHPEIAAGDMNAKRKVPVRAIVGSEDAVVSASSARSVFRNPAPLVVTGGHTSLKAPESHLDDRYRALALDIGWSYRETFALLCSACAAGDRVAQAKFFDRWGRAIKVRVESAFPESADSGELEKTLAVLTWKLNTVHTPRLPSSVLNDALVYLRFLRRFAKS